MTGRARTADILSDTFKSLISSPQTNTVGRNPVGGPKPMEHGSVSFEIRISGFEADVDWKSGQLRLVLVRPNRQTTDSFFYFRKIRTKLRQGQDTDSTVRQRRLWRISRSKSCLNFGLQRLSDYEHWDFLQLHWCLLSFQFRSRWRLHKTFNECNRLICKYDHRK